MKLYKTILASLVCTSAFVTSAHAVPVAISQLYTPPTTKVITTSTPYDFVLDIGSVYNALTHHLTNNGTITFSLSDPQAGKEELKFIFAYSVSMLNGVQTYTVGGMNNVNVSGTDIDTQVATLNAASFNDLDADGKLAIRVAALSGEYNFVSARFDGFSELDATVPEPGTFVLMGLAMAGVGFARRRKQA